MAVKAIPQPPMEITLLELTKIKMDVSIQVREKLDLEIIARYRDVLDELPPILVFDIEGVLYLIDGFHRVGAAQADGRKALPAIIRTGTWEQGEDAAIGANAHHGKPYSKSEKERAIRRLLARGLGQRAIANLVGCSQKHVSEITQADRARAALIEDGLVIPDRFPDEAVRAVVNAPKGQWGKVIEASIENDWSAREVGAVAAELARPDTTADRKAALLDGREPPLTRTEEGKDAVLPETLRREVEKGTSKAPLLALKNALAAFGKLRTFSIEATVESVSTETRNQLQIRDDLDGFITYGQELSKALKATTAPRLVANGRR